MYVVSAMLRIIYASFFINPAGTTEWPSDAKREGYTFYAPFYISAKLMQYLWCKGVTK